MEDQDKGLLAFSFANYANDFDRHIRDSIRGYGDLLSDVVLMSDYFVEDNSAVLDIGCSTGNFLATIKARNEARCPGARFIGLDVEPEFSSAWEAMKDDNIHFLVSDIRNFAIPESCSFVTSIFSLQFISEKDRRDILHRLFDAINPGGALVIAEKVFVENSKIHDIVASLHYEFKRRGFSEAEIAKKAQALRSLMKPWTESRLMDALGEAGFNRGNVQCFWRSHNFLALVALR